MNRISFLNRGYAFKGLLAVFRDCLIIIVDILPSSDKVLIHVHKFLCVSCISEF